MILITIEQTYEFCFIYFDFHSNNEKFFEYNLYFRKSPKSIDSELKKIARKIEEESIIENWMSENDPFSFVLDACQNGQGRRDVSGKNQPGF